MKLRLARRKARRRGRPRCSTSRSADLQESLDELRELARGIHPAVLTDRGLGPALRGLADRAPLPVELAGDAPERPAAAGRDRGLLRRRRGAHQRRQVRARAARRPCASSAPANACVVEVADDGVGGARLDGGSGLRGLADRVAALDGRLEVESPPGAGTRLRVELPSSAGT